MYILYIMLIANLQSDVELEVGPFKTMDECWVEAEKIAPSPEVFNVRCQLVE